MKLVVSIIIIGSVVACIIGIPLLSATFSDSSEDIEKQTKFQSTKNEPVLIASQGNKSSFIILKDTEVILDVPLVLEEIRPTVESSIAPEIIKANEFYEKKNYHEALTLYEFVLSSDPTNVYALNGKGGTLLSLKEFDAAITTFEQTILFYPDNINAINGKAYSLYLKSFPYSLPGLRLDSLSTYHKALELDPKNLNSLNGIASVLTTLERYEEAVQYFNTALSVDPKNDNARNGLINLWIKRGNSEVQFFYFESAIRYFDKALDLDTTHLNALLSKANAYTEWGKSKQVHYNTAEKQLNHILRIYPDNVEALVGMGYVLNEQLKFEQALPYYEKALEIDPEHFNAQRGQSLALRHVLYGGN